MFLIEIYIFCSIVHISCKGAHLWGGKQEQTLLKCGSPKNSKWFAKVKKKLNLEQWTYLFVWFYAHLLTKTQKWFATNVKESIEHNFDKNKFCKFWFYKYLSRSTIRFYKKVPFEILFLFWGNFFFSNSPGLYEGLEPLPGVVLVLHSREDHQEEEELHRKLVHLALADKRERTKKIKLNIYTLDT